MFFIFIFDHLLSIPFSSSEVFLSFLFEQLIHFWDREIIFLFVCSFCPTTVPTIWLGVSQFCFTLSLLFCFCFHLSFFSVGHHISLRNDILADICSVLNWFLFVLRVEIVFRKCKERVREKVCVRKWERVCVFNVCVCAKESEKVREREREF